MDTITTTGQHDQEDVFLVCPKRRNVVVSTSEARSSQVDFEFSLHHIVSDYYDNVLLTRNVQRNVITKSVHVGINQFMDSRRIIDGELRDWPLDDDCRRKLSTLAFHEAKIMVAKLMSERQRNVLVIPYKVVVVSKRRVLDENIAMELMAQRSMDYGMVPATDYSIESLKIKTTTTTSSISCEDQEEESCSICLENFQRGCKVVSMPCNHDFHEDCIKKWLKSSHYCPVCRFQMPAKTLVHAKV